MTRFFQLIKEMRIGITTKNISLGIMNKKHTEKIIKDYLELPDHIDNYYNLKIHPVMRDKEETPHVDGE